ncbi:MAG: hypothetical protein HYX38_33635 [Rhodospirillales bacterium]|nr:hypothetical protein [Rhodospirillales bacterium]
MNAMDVASFLHEIGEELTDCRTSVRDLAALAFEADGRDISIQIRRDLHAPSYPPLGAILDKIGATCLAQGIAVGQLRRISFLEGEIRVELADDSGQTSTVHSYPIEMTVRSPLLPSALLQQR